MEPKEETDGLLIMLRRFKYVRIYIFCKFHPCAENSPIFANMNRVADTVELVLSVFICLEVEATDQSDYLLMKHCRKCMTLYIQHIMTYKTRFDIPLLSLSLSSQRKFDDRTVFLCHN